MSTLIVGVIAILRRFEQGLPSLNSLHSTTLRAHSASRVRKISAYGNHQPPLIYYNIVNIHGVSSIVPRIMAKLLYICIGLLIVWTLYKIFLYYIGGILKRLLKKSLIGINIYTLISEPEQQLALPLLKLLNFLWNFILLMLLAFPLAASGAGIVILSQISALGLIDFTDWSIRQIIAVTI
jgi:hypothetical protein